MISGAASTDSRARFARFAWWVLFYNIPVILWGAYVRISFSGDGCGADWPFCAGRVLPQNMARPMAIEFTHRVMTSLDLGLVAVLVWWAFRIFPRGEVVRRCARWSAYFLLVEALLGAGLVIFRKVAHDESAGRAIYLSAHLTNTMLLLGALTATAWFAHTPGARLAWKGIASAIRGALLVSLGVSVTGALAALGDTLFPASSLSYGIRQDFSGGATALLRLRLFHPIVAIAGAMYLFWAASRLMRIGDGQARTAAVRVVILVAVQVALGAANIALLAPVWMQLVHLLMADLVWIAVVVMALESIELWDAEPMKSAICGWRETHAPRSPR
jgi:heme A synthase